ncbi:MAG: phosphohydrolase [Deltaproteobacteria bacterium]|nr:MAG: phosphohydrolase [Deltaproteobacteria bacterium]
MLDFSFKQVQMKNALKIAKRIVVIDHHPTAFNELLPINEVENLELHLDTKNSGAVLAWKYLHKDEPIPLILAHIEDRDLWNFKMDDTRAVTAALFSYPDVFNNLEVFNNVIYNTHALIREGETLLRQYNTDLARILEVNQRSMTIGGHDVTVCNAPPKFSSDIGNMIATTGGVFGATYHDTKKHRIFSLRSIKGGFNVEAIAASYGGGGHKAAAGFSVDRDHVLAKC